MAAAVYAIHLYLHARNMSCNAVLWPLTAPCHGGGLVKWCVWWGGGGKGGEGCMRVHVRVRISCGMEVAVACHTWQ